MYQWMVAAYRQADRHLMEALIASLQSVPAVLVELATLDRTLRKRAADVLAYFDRPGTSNGPARRSTAAWKASAD